jgi:hypothetical protein
MNQITKNILDILLKIKDTQPKLTSCGYSQSILSVSPTKLADSTVDMNFLGYVFDQNYGTNKGCKKIDFPIAISFSIYDVDEKDFASIEWGTINSAIGYCVFKGFNHEYASELKTEEKKSKCSCSIEQVMYRGCICGGT